MCCSATRVANSLSSVLTRSFPLGYKVRSHGPENVQHSRFWIPTEYPDSCIICPTRSRLIEVIPSGTICHAALFPHNSIANPSPISSLHKPSGREGFNSAGGPLGGPDGGPDGGPLGGPDGGPEGGPLGGPDGGPEGGPLGGPDGGPEGGPLGGPDGGPDGGPEGGPLGGPDGGPEGGPDGGPDGGPEGGPEGPGGKAGGVEAVIG